MTSLPPAGTYNPPVKGHYLDTINLDGLDLFFNKTGMAPAQITEIQGRLNAVFTSAAGNTAACTEKKSLHAGTAILSIDGLNQTTYRSVFNLLNHLLPAAKGYGLKPTDEAIRDGACIVYVDFSAPAAEQ